MRPKPATIAELRASLPVITRRHLEEAVSRIVAAKQRGGRVVVVTGSGPNLHEGVTTQIAELIRHGLIDGVVTSSAVIAHEMAGTLDRVKRIRIEREEEFGIPMKLLPRGGVFEITELSPTQRHELEEEFPAAGWKMYDRLADAPGSRVIKAAGNMAWPMGLRTERLAQEIRNAASQYGVSLEHLAGLGASPWTMIGAGARKGVCVLVSIPQLVGGGAVGIAIGDSISIARRSRSIAEMLAGADVIIESAIALSQEIHDGPFETYTGHGIWAGWDQLGTYSLQDKTIARIDLDPNLERAWRMEREDANVQEAINQGLPKTKRTGMPFRMEMSGFARLEGSIPITADIGVAWPVLVCALEERLGLRLEFVCAPQETEEGKKMRNWIVDEVAYLNRGVMYSEAERTIRRSGPGFLAG
jgi:Deoxyhypusine synthase